MSIELLANEIVRRNLREAEQRALIARLPRTSSAFVFRPDVAVRQLVANGLRVLAARLDPCLSCEPSLVVVARSR
jgi:hypothetical protein